jgi:hypothetical protein
MKKQTLPSYDMNGNNPARSWYTMLLFLSANAPKQKIFAINLSSSLPIRFGPNVPLYAWLGLTGNLFIIGNAGGICWAAGCVGAVGMVGTGCNLVWGCLGCVLFMPCLGRFICPLAVPGLALRYFGMSFLVILGHRLRKPFLVAFNNVEIFGLHKD